MQPLRDNQPENVTASPNPFPSTENKSLSPGSEAHVKKRNRISFVCQACRRSKTKCDREKPRCGRCIQHGIQCIYDVEKQPAPKNPSKDATIARLEKDVTYWRNKALGIDGDGNGYTDTSKRQYENNEPAFQADENKRIKSTRSASLGVFPDDVRVNLYKTHPSMIINKVMKREVKPLSENYAITQDTFLSGLIASIFLNPSKNTMIPALSASASVCRAQPSVTNNVIQLKEMLIRQCHSESQKSRINEFTERILQNTATNGKRIGLVPIAMRSALDRHYLEDFCPKNGEYSDVLKSYIKEMELILPPLEILNSYKNHFYESVFPNLPFLNRHLFEESLKLTLFEDENDSSKVKIKLGNSRLRNKMENLSILMVILKLSFISLRFIEEGSKEYNSHINREVLKKYPIGNEAILLAESVLSSENLFACANENTITCLLYIWSFFVHSPEEGDFFLEHPTDVLTGVIVMLATSIGLHRDPSDFPRLCEVENSSVLNHRRMLWVSITTTVCIESSLKGRNPLSLDAAMSQFIEITNPNSLSIYMERIRKDMTTPDEHFLRLHEVCFKRSQLALLIHDLDKLSLTYEDSFSLNEMEGLRVKIQNFVAENFKLTELNKKTAKNAAIEQTQDYKSSLCAAENSMGLHSLILSRLMLLRASMALFFHFETALGQQPELLPFYHKYFIRVCVDALTLVKHITKYFSDGYTANLLPSNSYNITKAAQIALSSTFFGLLGIIMRIEFSGNMLFSQYQDQAANNSDFILHENNRKLELLSVLKRDLEIALENIYRVASKHLRFTYFSVFKMLALFDVIIQRMKKGELWSFMLRLQHVKEMNRRSVKALNMTLSLDLDGEYPIISRLKRKNHMINFTDTDLRTICREVKKILQDEQGSMKCNDPSSSFPGPLNSSPVDNSNPLMGNLEKLSSAAAMSQNLDFQSNFSGVPEIEKMNDVGTAASNETQSSGDSGIELDLGAGLGVPMDFPGLFGGLDLFDYDFLFSNDV